MRILGWPAIDAGARSSHPDGELAVIVVAVGSLLLVEDDRAEAVLVEDLIADAVSDIRVVWVQSMAHERGVEYIGFAVDGAKRMQSLINDLLTFSRVGRLNTSETEVDLDTTLDTALANLAAAIEESDAEIVRPQQPLPQIVGDAMLLTMLWQNLFGNAVKFRHKDRPPRVVIECEQGTGNHDGEWLLSVSDNGIGIPDEFSDKVFVIFQRLHGREVYAGTGVGLALVKKIVEHHGGTVWIDPSYTDGTRFNFTLPVPVDTADSTALEGAQA